jgi:hypothetical protein
MWTYEGAVKEYVEKQRREKRQVSDTNYRTTSLEHRFSSAISFPHSATNVPFRTLPSSPVSSRYQHQLMHADLRSTSTHLSTKSNFNNAISSPFSIKVLGDLCISFRVHRPPKYKTKQCLNESNFPCTELLAL